MPRLLSAHVPVFDFEAPALVGSPDPVAATATLTFVSGTQPDDGDYLTINDGRGIQRVFEFDNNAVVQRNRVLVTIGINVAATLANLMAAISGSGLNVTPSDTTGMGDPQVTLTHNFPGKRPNDTPIPTVGTKCPVSTAFAGGADANDVLVPIIWRVAQGGVVNFRFVTGNGISYLVTLQVSADNVTWANTSASGNGQAVVAEQVDAVSHRNFELNLRAGLDNFLRLVASGINGNGGRGQVQVRSEAKLDVLRS
jgi:hypothetical protein